MGESTRAAVIGHPVHHSLSPAMFNAAFLEEGRRWTYGAFEVTSESVAEFVRSVRDGQFGAFSVTMPLKEEIIGHLDSVDAHAEALRAVNSVRVVESRLIGFNTDGDGCCDALVQQGGATLEGARSVVFGAGGTARSVALSLLERGAEVSIVNRSHENAERAVAMLAKTRPSARITQVATPNLASADVIVNTTPVGMGVLSGQTVADLSDIRQGTVVLDAVYQPLDTSFLLDARSHGARTVDGLWMLVYQAVRQYSLWFGTSASVATMRRAAEQELLQRRK